jgi:DMSO/TMAO reductase YedYZ molybdopterin-dependent catalytic subunit
MRRFNENKRLQSLILILFVIFTFGYHLIYIETVRSNDEIPITPNDEFFKISIDYWDIDPETYNLVVTGQVNNPLNLSLDEIKALPVTSEIVRLTCINYKSGARDLTGVANWTGVKLSNILELAEINLEKTADISFHTLDLSTGGYSTSLNTEEAYWDDVILAYEMNGEPLPKDHGFPLRLVCPRMFGYKWIKWVAYINVTTTDYKGFWENLGFDDSPYVDIENLPIYYPLTSDNEVPSTEKQKISWFGFELFLTALITLTLTRLQKKKKEN